MAARILVGVVRVAAAWCEGWRGGGEARRRQRAEAKKVGDGVAALWAEAKAAEVKAGQGGTDGGLDGSGGGGEMVSAGCDGGVDGTAAAAACGGTTAAWTAYTHAWVDGCRRAVQRVLWKHVSKPQPNPHERRAGRLRSQERRRWRC